ncbi:Mitochondrial Protein Translocase (MPT) Family [Thraustotheca clavata]|uniref:Mitochondrial Protein Translocase (MPT) Family n=1 Tax=Thraustotheca clavata TaxID=74557 RepID=A0A1V9ZVZ0_9STRA|nr:Mitochondrial Protein Translocase (MPT) Family [Thraustotheca clavata]
MTLLTIPCDTNTAAFLVANNVLHEEGPFYLHVQEKNGENDLYQAAHIWWLAHASVPTVALGIALTRRKNENEMTMLTVAEYTPIHVFNTFEDDFVQDLNDEIPFIQVANGNDSLCGYLNGALRMDVDDVLTTEETQCRWFLTTEELKHTFDHIDFTKPINVLGYKIEQAALVAMALVLAGHSRVKLCLFTLDNELVAKLPGNTTTEVFSLEGVYKVTSDGDFDISNYTTATLDAEAVQGLMTSFDSEMTTKKKKPKQVEPIVAVDYRKQFFTMPSPLPKSEFLKIAAAIYRATSLVLAPFGVLCPNPNPNLTETSMLELKTKNGHILQEIIEVVSDLVYSDFEVDESTMAMSAQKWLHDESDSECSAAMNRINHLGTTLRETPRVVEIETPLDDVVTSTEDIAARIHAALATKVPWALTPPELPDFTHPPPPIEKMTWYPTVVYALGFNMTSAKKPLNKQSTLQVKAKIQAVYQGLREAILSKDKTIDAVQLQALVDCSEHAEKVHDTTKQTFSTHHVVNDGVFVDPRMTQAAQFAFKDKITDGNRAYNRADYEDAIAYYSQAMNCVPLYHSSIAEALSKRSKAYIALNKYERARTDSNKALEISAFCMDAYANLGVLAEKELDYEEALQMHVLAFILGGSRAPDQADTIERVSKFVGREKAKDIWSTMEMRHELPSTWLVDSYFQSFYRDADYPMSTISVSKLEQLDPATMFEELLIRAIHYKRNRQYKLAQVDFATLSNFVLTQIDTNDDLTSLDAKVRKHYVIALNMHASFMYITGDVNTALDVIDHALELDPEHINSVIKKGGFLVEIGDFDGALGMFEEAAKLDGNNSDIYLHQGQMELIMCDYSAAVTSLRKSMTRCETLAVTHISYGMALYKAGSIYQSLDVFKTALDLFPDSHEVRLFYGDVLSDRGDYGQAMAHLRKAYELSPECPLHLLNAGRIFVATNDAAHAITHFEEALRLDAKCSAGHLDLAQVYFAQGHVEEAMKHFDAAIDTCRFLPEVEDACACRAVAMMQLHATEILGVDLRHMLKKTK